MANRFASTAPSEGAHERDLTETGWSQMSDQVLPIRATVLLAFFARIRIDQECWLWTGAQKHNGYGVAHPDGTAVTELAHRTAYRWFVGSIPEGYDVHHICQQPLCVNPKHLETIAPDEHRSAHAGARCPRGHLLTPENTYQSATNSRRCRLCHRLGNRLGSRSLVAASGEDSNA